MNVNIEKLIAMLAYNLISLGLILRSFALFCFLPQISQILLRLFDPNVIKLRIFCHFDQREKSHNVSNI